jgi:hypothetical protein
MKCYEDPDSTLNNTNLYHRGFEQLCNSKRISSRAHSRLVAQFNDVMTEVEIEQWVLLRIWSSIGGKRKTIVRFIDNVQRFVVHVEPAIIIQISFKLKPN